MPDYLAVYLKQNGLDTAAFAQLIQRYYQPLAEKLAQQATGAVPLVVGVNGGQGSGKSTLAQILQQTLLHKHQLHTVVLSLDDFYLSKQKRQYLAETIHPLLATRGVPGTHDVALGMEVLQGLLQHRPVKMPIFDKAQDDLLSSGKWREITPPVDIILFEGWCVGANPIPADTLALEPNSLEQQYDPELVWRTYFNQQLATQYQQWFAHIHTLLMLKVPGMAEVVAWRTRQQAGNAGEQIDVGAFVQHYERLTRHMLQTMPEQADVVFHLDGAHGIAAVSGQL